MNKYIHRAIAYLLFIAVVSHTNIPTILHAFLPCYSMLFANNILMIEYILTWYIIQLVIVYRLFLLVKAAAETVYKVGLLAINRFRFSMELVCKLRIGVNTLAHFLASHGLYWVIISYLNGSRGCIAEFSPS